MVTTLDGKEVIDLKKGDTVRVLTLFGWTKMTVDDVREEYATAYNCATFAAWLNKENGRWISSTCFNPQAIAKVQLV